MTQTKEYKGFTITVTDEFHFLVNLGGTDQDRHETYGGVTKAIDAHLAAKVIADQKPLPVISDQGERTTIRGIHKGYGALLFNPILKLGQHPAVYVDHPTVAKVLARRHALREQLQLLEGELKNVHLSGAKGWITQEQFAELWEKLCAQYETAKGLAETLPNPAPRFVLVRPDGQHYHESITCSMVDSSEYRLVTREQAAPLRPCACVPEVAT